MSHGKRTAIKTACGTAFVCVFPIKELFDKSRSNAIQILIFIFQRQFVYTKADEDKKVIRERLFLRFVQGLLLSGKWRKSDASEAFEKIRESFPFYGKFFIVVKLPL